MEEHILRLLGHFRHEHVKKDVAAAGTIVTEYTTVTAAPTNPAVIVWVDNEGHVLSTETLMDISFRPTVTPETTSNATSTESTMIFTAARNTQAPAPVETSTAAPSQAFLTTSTQLSASATAEAPSPLVFPVIPSSSSTQAGNAKAAGGMPNTGGSDLRTSSATTPGFNGLGIGYDILDDSGNCKSASTVESDFNIFDSAYSVVRIYGTTCNQVSLVAAQAAQRDMKVFAGINDPTVDIASAIQAIVSQAGSNLDVVDTINIGNEWVNSNGAGAVPVVTAALAAARTALAGVFSGHIVTVDTFNALIANPALCAASDYCAANCHAFFDPNTDGAGAGGFVQSQVANIAAANPGKSVVITESGWPWADYSSSPNPKATESQQVAAIASLKGSFSNNLFLFQGFDTLYRIDNYERYFGIYDHDD